MTFAEKLVQSLRAKSGFGKGFNRVADWSVRFAGIFILALQVCSAETIRYVYDSRSELIKVLGETNVYFECRYDAVGNLQWLADGGVTNVYHTNALNQYTVVSNNLGVVREIGYDRSGNTTRIGRSCYSWDAANRLTIMGPLAPANGALVVRNEYDYLGRRTKKTVLSMKNIPESQGTLPTPHVIPDYETVSVTSFVYDNYRLIHETTELPNGQKKEIQYFWGADLSGTLDGAGGIGGLLALCIGGQFYFAVYDNQGNIFQYVDETGKVVSCRLYSPFGRMKHGSETSAELYRQFHFWHSTKYYDDEMGLYDFGNRYYSPFLRRWMNRDPIGENGGVHLYRYVDNAPTYKIDPDGCIPLDTIWDLGNVIYDLFVGDAVALAADTAALMVPYLPAGTTKLVKSAKLSQVQKVCPGVKHLEVTYKYEIHGNKHFQLKGMKRPTHANWKREPWVLRTRNEPAQFRPGFTHEDAKRLAEKALKDAQNKGRVKTAEVDGFVYDARELIGASNGKPTSHIQIRITPQGNLHIRPTER